MPDADRPEPDADGASPTRAAAAVLAVHLLGNLAHGGVHVAAPVPTTPFQAVFVAVVLVAVPVAAVVAMARGRLRAGGALFAAAMAASLAFAGYFHWLSATPDNVAAVAAPWRGPFEASAAVVAVADLVGIGVGVGAVRSDAGTGAAAGASGD